MGVIWENYLDDFVQGTLLTLGLTAASFVLAAVIGTAIAAFRISPIVPLRTFGLIYVEIFRNVPLMSLIILVVYALPEVSIMLDYVPAVILALSLVGGAFIAEALRSGINSVGVGQIEAARSVGLTFVGVLRLVVLPQAFRSMIQPLITVLIAIFLSTSLAGVVGVRDLTQTVAYINNREALGLLTFAIAAAIYATISLLIAWVGGIVERRVRVKR
ncbi:MAG: amino acid ABC transporter permease [Microthrixaceae bacterium]|nr:amino acid ABC transporter permease [Microthrixaceae bacterium]